VSFPAELTTERLVLRAPRPEDCAAYVAFYTSARRRATRPPETGDEPQAALMGRFAGVMAHWRDKGFGRYIVEIAGIDAPAGLIGPHQPQGYPEPEIAWHLWHDAVEGHGLAYEAAEAARGAAYRGLGWSTAVSYIRPFNARSRRLAERLGATRDPAAEGAAGLPEHETYRHPGPEAPR